MDGAGWGDREWAVKPMKWIVAAVLCASSCLGAVTHDYTVKLEHGRLHVADLNAALTSELHVPAVPTTTDLDLSSAEGRDFVSAVNACLWRGSTLRVSPERAELRMEPLGDEGKVRSLKRMARLITAERASAATVAHAKRWGMFIPVPIDPNRPLVVLLHGLDANRGDCVPMAQLIQRDGGQVALFGYPGDQPIADSGSSFGAQMESLRSQYPKMPIYIVAHSMGGLVARCYLEGPDYAGGVQKFIMIAPPNHGSTWAPLRMALSIQEHYYLRALDPGWHWTWFITEGLGEAGADLSPDSALLHELNERPRREGTQYTIIAGSVSDLDRVEAEVATSASSFIPKPTRRWWGIGRAYGNMQKFAEDRRTRTGDNDGPVTIKSAELKNVKDVVVIPADHRSLFLPNEGKAPAAYAVVQDRLAK
jgi:pimeloyl-ACP methyl ester carboxylesterase